MHLVYKRCVDGCAGIVHLHASELAQFVQRRQDGGGAIFKSCRAVMLQNLKVPMLWCLVAARCASDHRLILPSFVPWRNVQS